MLKISIKFLTFKIYVALLFIIYFPILGSSGGGYGGSDGGLSPLAALIAPLAALALLGAASLISLNPTLLQLAVIQGKRKRRRRRRRWADNEEDNEYQVRQL